MRAFIAGLLICTVAGAAHAEIYRCENANGVVEYSNSAGSGKDRNCKAINLPPVTVIPAPRLPARAMTGSTAAASPSSFPKVDSATQKTRDSDRRRILEDELNKEQARLADLQKQYNNGEPERVGGERNYQKYLDRVQQLKQDVERSQGNVDSLKRELANIQ